MNYTITKYEEKSDALIICLVSDHCQIKHFFNPIERLPENRQETIEHLIARLEVMEEEYVAPEKFVSKLPEVLAMPLDLSRIAAKKEILLQTKAAISARVAEAQLQELADNEEKARIAAERSAAELEAAANSEPGPIEDPDPVIPEGGS